MGEGTVGGQGVGAPGRRGVLRGVAATGATALTLSAVEFRGAGRARAESGDETREVSGHLPTGAADFVYLPVRVPEGVREIAVSYSYDKPEVPDGTLANSCDIGIFDQHGTALGGRGYRGWSGGARTEFAINASEATPGYVPGPVEAGTWHVVLGPYQVAPQGMDYQVKVTLRYGRPGKPYTPSYPPQRAKGRGRAWYRGDCHLHTVYSDGKRTVPELAAAARAGKLDFIVSTDHNTATAHGALGPVAGPDLLILTGEEITTRNGHCLALGTDPGTFVDWRYRARDGVFSRFTRQVHQAGGLVVPAHPYCPFIACQWKFGYADADAVEVWNGPWTADDELALNDWDGTLVASVRGDGRWLPAMGNSDAHSEPQVVGLPQTVVLADDLERHALLDGIRAGRTWIAESAEVGLEFSAAGGKGLHAGIGERLATRPEDEVTVTAKVSGAASGALVRFMTDEGQMYQTALPDSGSGTVSWQTTASLAAYVRAEVRQVPADGGASGLPGAMIALTNPVFLGRAGR